MTADACRGWRENLGALLLDQLDADERVATEAHLAGCPACRAELDLLAPVARALPLAELEQLGPAAAPAPPRSLGKRVERGIAAEKRARRVRRFRLGGVAVATAAAAAAVAAILFLGGGAERAQTPGGQPQRVAFTSTPRGVEIGATLAPRAWGSEISLEVRGITPGTRCHVWLRRADGKRVDAGSFRYRYEGGSDGAALSSSLRPSQARSIAVRAGNRTFVAPVSS
jgi:anti-sigma factor RsiW